MDYKAFLEKLEAGELRAAEPDSSEIGWKVNVEVKQRILEIFKNYSNSLMGEKKGNRAEFIDRKPLETRKFTINDKIRIVPGGSSIRRGSFLGKNVIIMPPSYVNIGAYIDNDTMVDSNALVGSCAQIGKNVHLSAGVQIGGVLSPIGLRPVIIEDNAFIGAGSSVVEGFIVKSGAVIAPGVFLSASIPIYDRVNKKVLKGYIPKNALVVPGTRPDNSEWSKEHSLAIACAIIVKYRDSKTDNALACENILTP